MIQYPLIFLGGLLGSSHCVGMCGAFAISIGACTNRWQTNFLRQIVYTLGRLFTYACVGAIVTLLGMRIMKGTVPLVQGGLSCLAGLLLVIQGLHATGWWLRTWKSSRSNFCPGSILLRGFLTGPGILPVFLAGLMTGFLPCGLVYAYLALAASSGDVLEGIATMTLFGLGTAPLMVMTGVGGSLLSQTSRRRLLNVAGYCVLLTGLLTFFRGSMAVKSVFEAGSALCPYCASAETNR